MVGQAEPCRGRTGGEHLGWEQARVADVEIVDSGRDRCKQVVGPFRCGKALDLRCERRHLGRLRDERMDTLDLVGRLPAVASGGAEPQIVIGAASDRDRSGRLLERDRSRP